MEVHSISRFKFQSVAILAPLTSLSYSLFFVIYFLNRFHRDGPFAVSMSLCKIGAHYNSCSFSIMVKGVVNWFNVFWETCIYHYSQLSLWWSWHLAITDTPTVHSTYNWSQAKYIEALTEKKTLLLRTLDLKDSGNRQFSRICSWPRPQKARTFRCVSAFWSTLIRRAFSSKMHWFENALESRSIRKRIHILLECKDSGTLENFKL